MAHKSHWHATTAKQKSRRDLRKRLATFEQGNSLNLIGYIIDRIRARIINL